MPREHAVPPLTARALKARARRLLQRIFSTAHAPFRVDVGVAYSTIQKRHFTICSAVIVRGCGIGSRRLNCEGATPRQALARLVIKLESLLRDRIERDQRAITRVA